MELDATTFALEVVNFLALLWLLNRLLYRPLQGALRRREETAAAQAKATAEERDALHSRAETLDRMSASLDARRDAAEHELAQAMAAERDRRTAALMQDLKTEREKVTARVAEEERSAREQGDARLRERAAAFVAEYLSRIASPAVEAAVLDLFLADLATQGEAARAALRDGLVPGARPPAVDVCTAFQPPSMMREQVDARIRALIGAPVQTDWRIDPALMAGICVHLPGHQLEASLRSGVDAFTTVAT